MSESSKSKSLNLHSTPTLQCKDLHEYLKSRSSHFLETLYNYPTICLAVYRELPELARHFVIRLLFVEQPVPQAVVASWVSQTHAKEQIKASEALSELSVWNEAPIPGGLPGWFLSHSFKKNLKVALLGGGRPWSMSQTLEPDGKARDVAFLDAYALERWECVLHYMVGSQQTEGISADAVRILLHAGLMTRDAEDGSAVITKAGFQFLLLSTAKQVWLFLQHYLHTAEKRNLSSAECLAFLYQLSFSTLGKDYSTEGMSNNMLVFLQHLREFGLLYQRKRKAGRFYPTRLALNITCVRDEAGLAGGGRGVGYIVVESNYRVYGYTQSALQVALLGLFTELMYRFPNLVVGVITRESVRQAFRGGISAEQIIKYLEQHSHPQMLNTDSAGVAACTSVLPPTVLDQVRLWESERNRFTYTEGVVYNQFLSQADFVVLRDYARQERVLSWQNERTRTMVVTKPGHDDVKRFWKRYSKSS
ncbi:general transcription factor IIH subunit 4 isoform X3 [Leptidea sinapis]|uniref:general transcription factor IIH subunit 4 isoform X1 n=1 Tax=Leptidea sinapis TaxID=189913 RepID=UPI00212C6014|nr:general transcription factor IIH subunit 4 isoform X1 [Leptidea sinapis]XP_050668285.1 general transcription factor IIH subunit 4 isoform X2 [Leptidea sinapis]XP_050668287.1 general transcription factor IIH subunit 4 isoform X3 [Leptidea sinapis]